MAKAESLPAKVATLAAKLAETTATLAEITAKFDALQLQVKKLTNKVAQVEHETEKRLDDLSGQISPRSINSFTGLDYGPALKLPYPEIGYQ